MSTIRELNKTDWKGALAIKTACRLTPDPKLYTIKVKREEYVRLLKGKKHFIVVSDDMNLLPAIDLIHIHCDTFQTNKKEYLEETLDADEEIESKVNVFQVMYKENNIVEVNRLR